MSLVSCKSMNNNDKENRDTAIHYFVDTAASMGTEIVFFYHNDTLSGSAVLIEEEKRSTYIDYLFINDSILASEEIFVYNDPLSMRRDITKDTFWNTPDDLIFYADYILDYKGEIIWKEIKIDDDSINIINNVFPLIDSLVRHSEYNKRCGGIALRHFVK